MDSGICPKTLTHYATEVKRLTEAGVQVALVVGGGNIARGSELATSAPIAPQPTIWACWRR